MRYNYDYSNKEHDGIIYKSVLFFLNNFLFELSNEDLQSYINFILINKKVEPELFINQIQKVNSLKQKIDNNKKGNISDTKEDIDIEDITEARFLADDSIFITFLSNLFLTQLSKKILDIPKNKMIIGENQIIIANENIIFSDLPGNNIIESKVKYILKKRILKDIIELDENKISKSFSFYNYLENEKNKNTYDSNKDMVEIIEKIKDIYEKELRIGKYSKPENDYSITNYIQGLLNYNGIDKNKFKSIIFYDLETLISNQSMVSGAFLGINFNSKKGPKVFLIMLYNDSKEINNYNIIYKKIFNKLLDKAKYKLRKLMGEKEIEFYFMEKSKFINSYINRVKQKEQIPLLSGFNIIGFDNPILFEKEPNYIETANNFSLDLYEFLSVVKDKGELNLLAKNNKLAGKLMSHEELLGYLKSEYLNNPKNFDGITKMLLYNIIDTLLTVDIFQLFINKVRQNRIKEIKGATKMLDKQSFIKYISDKINNINKI